MLKAQDVSEKPRRWVRVDHIEKHAVKGVYRELGGNVRMNGPAGRRLACGGPGHEFEDQPIGILAAERLLVEPLGHLPW